MSLKGQIKDLVSHLKLKIGQDYKRVGVCGVCLCVCLVHGCIMRKWAPGCKNVQAPPCPSNTGPPTCKRQKQLQTVQLFVVGLSLFNSFVSPFVLLCPFLVIFNQMLWSLGSRGQDLSGLWACVQ